MARKTDLTPCFRPHRQPALRERCRAQIDSLRAQEAKVAALRDSNASVRDQLASGQAHREAETAALRRQVAAAEQAVAEERDNHSASRAEVSLAGGTSTEFDAAAIQLRPGSVDKTLSPLTGGCAGAIASASC